MRPSPVYTSRGQNKQSGSTPNLLKFFFWFNLIEFYFYSLSSLPRRSLASLAEPLTPCQVQSSWTTIEGARLLNLGSRNFHRSLDPQIRCCRQTCIPRVVSVVSQKLESRFVDCNLPRESYIDI
jgi:hypothetical protein